MKSRIILTTRWRRMMLFSFFTPDIQIAVFRRRVFIDFYVFIDIEGSSLRRIQYFNIVCQNFDFTAGAWVFALPQRNLPDYLYNIFIAQLAGDIMAFF